MVFRCVVLMFDQTDVAFVLLVHSATGNGVGTQLPGWGDGGLCLDVEIGLSSSLRRGRH
jgi:hypothetical protein